MTDFRDYAKWYSVNFSNEQVLQGKETKFLRIKNNIYNIPTGERGAAVAANQNMYVLAIPEIVNIDPNPANQSSSSSNEDPYKDQIFFNGADVQEIQRAFKDEITDTNNIAINSDNYGFINAFWYGGPVVGSSEDDYKQYIPSPSYNLPLLGNVSLSDTGVFNTKYIQDPVNGTDAGTPPLLPNPAEKHNFRIDYKGDKPLVLKITFLITTANIRANNFLDICPKIDPISMADGDVRLDGTNWQYYDSGWQSLGFDTSLGEWPTYGVKHLHEKGKWTPGNGWDGEYFDFQETYIFCYPETSENPSRETDYWIDKQISEDSIVDDTSSYMLMRTNPKISGNIKMVTDSKGSIYLDTIEANDELANAKYKKNKISPNGNYAVDLNRFYSNLSKEIMYDLKQKDDQYENSKESYSEQYDFFYGYGVQQLLSKYYDENFKIFAPLWVKENLPDFFVVFKAPGPINKETFNSNSKETLLNEFMKGAQIIDTFDMRPGSTLGSYVRKIVSDSRFKSQPISISYENDVLSTWAGVSYKDGILCEKGEFLYDFFRRDQSVNDFEEFITTGYERNQMISTNLFNLEFLFDDEEAEDYDINRYFGFYFNEIELAKFEIFADAFNSIPNQTPTPKAGVDAEPYSVQPFIQNNLSGIVIPIDYYQGSGVVGQPEKVGLVQGKLPLENSVADPFRFFYVRDRDDNIDRIDSLAEYENGLVGNKDYYKYTGLKLTDTQADISKYGGITKLTAQLPASLLNKGHSQLVIDFSQSSTSESVLESLECLEIEFADINQQKQLWKCTANPTGIQPGDAWDFPLYNPDQLVYENTFSPEGTSADVAKAFTTCINSFDNRIFNAFNVGSRVYIKAELPGSSGNGLVFKRKLENTSDIQNVKFYDVNTMYEPDFDNITPNVNVTTTGDLIDFSETATSPTFNEYNVKLTNVTKVYQLVITVNSPFIGGEEFEINGTNILFPLSSPTISDTLTLIQTEVTNALVPNFSSSVITVGNEIILSFNDVITYTVISNGGGTYSTLPPSPINTYVSQSVTCEIRKNGGLIDTDVLILEGTGSNNVYSSNGIEFTLLNQPNVIYVVDDQWDIKPTNINIEQRFIGGNDRNRQRTTLKINDGLNLNPLDWYQTQKGKYSRLKEWDVQGTKIFKIPNLEDELFDSKGQLNGYDKLDTDVIIQVNDNDYEFYTTLENRIVGFDAFEPTLGIMSILPIKDFDFDWIVSSAAYTPNAELFKYYDKIDIEQGNTEDLQLYQSYDVIQGSAALEGWNSTTNVWEDINITDGSRWGGNVIYNTDDNFNTYLPTYYYDDTINSDKIDDSVTIIGDRDKWNYLWRNYKVIESLQVYTKLRVRCTSVENLIIEKYTYNQDKNLTAFNGFLGLSDFFSNDDEELLEKLVEENNIDRFFFDLLLSEYDRLRENFNKDYAVKSRVVPYINKWSQTGTDCRDNKYRLNNSLVFGVTNLSPDTEIKDRNPSLHTHEFYYLDRFPEDFPIDFLPNSRSYFFQSLGEEVKSGLTWYDILKTNDNDWFSKYFTVGYPSELDRVNGNKVKKKTEERYILTNFISGDETVQGIFRGGKFRILDLDPVSRESVQSSRKYEGYKFASILRIKRLGFDLTEPPAEIEYIANDKYKSIVQIITLYVNDYRIKGGGYGYSFLYAGADLLDGSNTKNERGNYVENIPASESEYAEQSFLNSYEVQRHWDSFIGGNVLKYADIKLNGIFNTNVVPVNASPRRLEAISVTTEEFNPINEIVPVDGNDYDMQKFYNPTLAGGNAGIGQLRIDVMERGEFSEISQFVPNFPSSNSLKYTINNQPGLDQNITVESDAVTIAGDFNVPYVSSGRSDTLLPFPTAKSTILPFIGYSENNNDVNAWYLSGGKDYLNRRLEEISYGDIREKVNNQDSSVKYYTVTDNGLVTGDYRFELLDFDKIEKQNRLLVSEDNEKPSVYEEVDLIGFNINDSRETEVIFRHRGRFEPKTTNIINFWLREDSDMTNHYNTDFLLSNTRLGVEYGPFGEIPNLFYSKVSNESIMKISDQSSFKSLYPYIGEIAIDNKDFNVFNSTWDNGYYRLYDTLKTFINIDGTNELMENKSFFGSKVMNTPKILEFNKFTTDEVKYEVITPLLSTDIPSLQEGDKKGSVLPTSQKSILKAKILADDRLIRGMIDGGAEREFERLKAEGITRFANLTDAELMEEVKSYLRLNILQLYKVSNVSVYAKSDADEEIDKIVRLDLSEAERISLNYILTKNTDVNQEEDFTFVIEQPLDTKKYKSFSFSITLERI